MGSFGTSAARACAAAGFLLVTACGGSASGLKTLGDKEAAGYATRCEAQTLQQAKELQSGAYNPAVLFVHTWPTGAPSGREAFLPEARLASALEAGEARRLLVTARGGLGKTRLAESLRAQLCGTTPVFLVDLKDVARVAADKANAGKNAIVELAVKDATVRSGEPEALLRAELASQRWIVLLDAIEEVDLVARPPAMAALKDLSAHYPQVQWAVFARPPVLDSDYGLEGLDARLEIPPLDCKVTDAFIARAFKTDEERERFHAFLRRFGLDEQGKFGLQCTYPYLSTYRDILTMADFHRKATGGDVLSSPASVYEALVGARLQKEFSNLGWTTVEALDMVDRLVRVQTQTTGQSNLQFGVETCQKAIDAKWGAAAVDTGVAGNEEQRRRHICEKSFQSALFQRAEGTGTWVFSDRATTDLFLARWLNGEIARNPSNDCSLLGQHVGLLSAPGVTRFLVGEPMGRKCLAQVIDTLCSKPDKPGAHVPLLDQGLPAGGGRVQVLQEARALASGMPNKTCVAAVLDDLDKTVSAQ